MKETVEYSCSYFTVFVATLYAVCFGLLKPSLGTNFKNEQEKNVY